MMHANLYNHFVEVVIDNVRTRLDIHQVGKYMSEVINKHTKGPCPNFASNIKHIRVIGQFLFLWNHQKTLFFS